MCVCVLCVRERLYFTLPPTNIVFISKWISITFSLVGVLK